MGLFKNKGSKETEKKVVKKEDLSSNNAASSADTNSGKLEHSAKDLEKKLSSMKEAVIRLQEQSSEKQKKVDDIKTENTELAEKLNNSNKDEGNLDDRVALLGIKEKELNEREFKIQQRENNRDSQENTLAVLKVDLEEKARQLDQKEKELEERLKNLQEREAKCSERESKIVEKDISSQKSLQEDRGQAEKELAIWKAEQIKDLTDVYSKLRVKFEEDLQNKQQELVGKIETEYIAKRQEKMDALKHELQSIRDQVAKEKNETEAVAIENQSIREELDREKDNFQSEKDWYNQQKKMLDNRKISIDKEVKERSKVLLQEKENKIKDLYNQLEIITSDYQSLFSELSSYDDLKAMFDGNPQLALEQLAEYKSECQKLKDQLAQCPGEEVRKERDAFKQQNKEYCGIIAEKNKALAKYEGEHREYFLLQIQKDAAEAKSKALETDLEVARNRVTYLEGEVLRLSSTEALAQERDKRIVDIQQGIKDLDNVENPEDENNQPKNEIEWLDEISRNCYDYGIIFPRRILYAFHTALKISDWSTIAVLAGVSGTGKSELPRLYAKMGRINFISVAVQPNWDSQESMLGYFNSIDNRFDAQPVLRFMVQCTEKLDKCMSIVLLDEMNLAHVEYYFAEFLSKLEQRRGTPKGSEPTIEVKLGAGVEPYLLPLKRNILWCGTMNQDETTKSLSDKVLDRGLVITFPRPKQLKSRSEMKNMNKFVMEKMGNRPMLSYSTWRSWVVLNVDSAKDEKDDKEGGVFQGAQLEELQRYKKTIEKINDCLGVVGRALGHRVWQSIEFYIANYPTVIAAKNKAKEGELTGELKMAMHIAFEDQIVQKVMPKLRGIDTRGNSKDNCLDQIKQILIDEKFQLENDFDKACELGYGQFIWSTAEFIDDNDIAGIEKDKNESKK